MQPYHYRETIDLMLGVHQSKIKKSGCYPSSEASEKCCNVTSLEALKFDSLL